MILRDLYQEENKFILSEVEWSQFVRTESSGLRSACREMEFLPMVDKTATALRASQ
jgi:hypothetical protein